MTDPLPKSAEAERCPRLDCKDGYIRDFSGRTANLGLCPWPGHKPVPQAEGEFTCPQCLVKVPHEHRPGPKHVRDWFAEGIARGEHSNSLADALAEAAGILVAQGDGKKSENVIHLSAALSAYIKSKEARRGE